MTSLCGLDWLESRLRGNTVPAITLRSTKLSGPAAYRPSPVPASALNVVPLPAATNPVPLCP
jgi:hypothetical protein